LQKSQVGSQQARVNTIAIEGRATFAAQQARTADLLDRGVFDIQKQKMAVSFYQFRTLSARG
jgi:hypothetical protein